MNSVYYQVSGTPWNEAWSEIYESTSSVAFDHVWQSLWPLEIRNLGSYVERNLSSDYDKEDQ